MDEWLDVLVPAGMPSSEVNSVLEAFEDPQAVARGDIVEHEHPALGTVRTIATPLRGDGRRGAGRARGPFRGEHTAEVLKELCGYTPERVLGLHAEGVFGDINLLV